MTQDEAEKLARIGKDRRLTFAEQERLCDHILSGDHKREIENAAIRKVAEHFKTRRNGGPYYDVGEKIAKECRALIQPPAQKEDGK